jgi:hypothetical protein
MRKYGDENILSLSTFDLHKMATNRLLELYRRVRHNDIYAWRTFDYGRTPIYDSQWSKLRGQIRLILDTREHVPRKKAIRHGRLRLRQQIEHKLKTKPQMSRRKRQKLLEVLRKSRKKSGT